MFPNKWFNLQYDGYSYILEYSINVTKKKRFRQFSFVHNKNPKPSIIMKLHFYLDIN